MQSTFKPLIHMMGRDYYATSEEARVSISLQTDTRHTDHVNHQAAQLPDPWAFFDKIYCITLDSRPDRTAEARKQFAKAGILERVEFVVVARHPDNREFGIFQSHMHCLQRGLRDNGSHILIFEDDVFFNRLHFPHLEECCRSLQALGEWQGLFLGCITDGSKRIGNRPLAKINYRCLAHAYALNRSFAEQIARQPWTGIPFDELLRRQQHSFYALYPMCAFQGRSGSDNQTVVIDRLRRLFGGLPFIQKMNEFYRINQTVLLPGTLTVMVLSALLLISLW